MIWEFHRDEYHKDLEKAPKADGRLGGAQWPASSDDTGANDLERNYNCFPEQLVMFGQSHHQHVLMKENSTVFLCIQQGLPCKDSRS